MSDFDPIKMADTESLIDEVLSRFDHAAFVGHRLNNDGNQTIYRYSDGNRVTVAGLAHGLARKMWSEIEEDLPERERDDGDDDE